MRPDIGCVGAKLIFENTRIQHAGVALGIGPVAGHIFANLPVGASGYLNHLNMIRNVSAVTGACIVMRRALYEAVGGLDAENLAVTCNDVDLCLKVGAAGYRSLWTPHAVLFHHESVSRGQDVAPEKRARLAREQAHMQKLWNLRPGRDPFVNPHQFNWL
jgi:GT2 family glycosyltransferase